MDNALSSKIITGDLAEGDEVYITGKNGILDITVGASVKTKAKK